MDIVEWREDNAEFIANALNPAEVVAVHFDPENDRACTVVVPDNQLSLAIGKRGQNARLAARLTGFKIDIKSESDYEELQAQLAQAPAKEASDSEEPVDAVDPELAAPASDLDEE